MPTTLTAGARSGLLVAAPNMVDVFFARTVVLLCDYDEDGALGIVINRPTDLTSDKVLEQMEVAGDIGIVQTVLWGGPVQPGAVFLTFNQLPELPDDAGPVFRIGNGVHVSPDRAVIEAVAAQRHEHGGVISLGYAGWAPGQLDGEIESGSWIHMEADPGLVFAVPPEERYEHCLRSLGVQSEMIWMHPIDE